MKPVIIHFVHNNKNYRIICQRKAGEYKWMDPKFGFPSLEIDNIGVEVQRTNMLGETVWSPIDSNRNLNPMTTGALLIGIMANLIAVLAEGRDQVPFDGGTFNLGDPPIPTLSCSGDGE